MNIILLGPQGSGKGTQAELLAKKFNLVHLEMGKVLRSVAYSSNKHAEVVKETLESGNLVPDEYVRLIAWDFINKHQPKTSGFIFEGYPRSLAQYEHVQDMLRKFGKKIDHAIVLNISQDESIRRLGGRLTCAKCGEIYNKITSPRPPINGRCEVCGGELVEREDDKAEAIGRRLKIYHSQTKKIVEKAREEGILMEVDGERPIEKIHQDIVARI